MEKNINHPKNQHFPTDPDAPKKVNGNSIKITDYLLFGIISLFTLITVFFSVYIIVEKYF